MLKSRTRSLLKFLTNKQNISALRKVSSNEFKCNRTFEEDFLQHHIETNSFQRTLLTVGSSVVSLLNPHRGDMIACLGETTGTLAHDYMLSQMENSEEGCEILRDRPRINSNTVDLGYLKGMPDGTLGKVYSDFLETNKVTPDSRLPVQFVDDIKLAYVVQRYREVHDLFHAVLGMPTNMLGEVTVKWVEAIQLHLPMCIGAAIFGPIRLKPKHRQLYLKYYLPWALETGMKSGFLLNLYFEKRWQQPISDLHKEMNIKPFKLPEKRSD